MFRPLEPMLSWSELITRGDMSHRMRDRFALKKMVRIVVHSSAPVLVSQTPLRARVLSINSEPGVVQKHLKRVRRLSRRVKQPLALNQACPRNRSRADPNTNHRQRFCEMACSGKRVSRSESLSLSASCADVLACSLQVRQV